MRNDTWVEMWTQLESYFQRPEETREVTDTRAKLYREHLDVLTDSQWRMAIRECIDTLPRHHFPSIAQIRDIAGVAPEAVRNAEIAKAAPDYAARHQAAMPERKFWEGPEQKALVEAVAHDYPFVPGIDVLDQVERIAVLAGLMKPVRLAAWSLAEIKAGKRLPLQANVHTAGPPLTEAQAVAFVESTRPETFRQTEAAAVVEARIREQDAPKLAPAVVPAPPKPKPNPPAMTPEPEEEFF